MGGWEAGPVRCTHPSLVARRGRIAMGMGRSLSIAFLPLLLQFLLSGQLGTTCPSMEENSGNNIPWRNERKWLPRQWLIKGVEPVVNEHGTIVQLITTMQTKFPCLENSKLRCIELDFISFSDPSSPLSFCQKEEYLIRSPQFLSTCRTYTK